MSGALPTTRAPAQVTVTSWSPTFVSRSFNLKTQRRRRGAGVQRWKLHFVYSTMEKTDYLDLYAFLNSQRGQYDTFTAALPGSITPRGSWPGTPLCSGVSAAGAASVATKGFTAGQSGVAKRGDFIKFGGHSKVYQVSTDANSDGGGLATLAIIPALVLAVADNEAITFSSVPFTLLLDADESNLALQPPTQGVLDFAATEDY